MQRSWQWGYRNPIASLTVPASMPQNPRSPLGPVGRRFGQGRGEHYFLFTRHASAANTFLARKYRRVPIFGLETRQLDSETSYGHGLHRVDHADSRVTAQGSRPSVAGVCSWSMQTYQCTQVTALLSDRMHA